MNKWKWYIDYTNYEYNNPRLCRYKEIDSIIVNNVVRSIFRFQLNSKNPELYVHKSNYIKSFNWLKDDIYFICNDTARNSVEWVYNIIRDNKWNFGSPLNYGLNNDKLMLGDFQILNSEDLETEYLMIAYDIINKHRNIVGAVSKRYDDYDSIFKSLCKSGDWNKIVEIEKCYNVKASSLFQPLDLIKRIRNFSASECELSLDDYNANEEHDMVSTTLADYRQHQHNHHTLVKLWFLHKFMSYDNHYEFTFRETMVMEEIKSRT